MPAKHGHPEAQQILRYLKQVAQSVGPMSHWVGYAYHFTELANLPSILTNNALYSRAEASRQALIEAEVGDRHILQQTSRDVLEYVRFYWRPRTPMLYQIEGIRSEDHYPGYSARCDIPAYICVPMSDMLSRADIRFTDRNAASAGYTAGSSLAFLATIPFDRVYHDSWLDEGEKREILSRRQAEIQVPVQFNLTDDTLVILRSMAELATLREKLAPSVLDAWKQRLVVSTRYPAFYKRWLFVDRVVRQGDTATVYWNGEADLSRVGQVPVRYVFENLNTGGRSELPKALEHWDGSHSLTFTGLGQVPAWRLTVSLKDIVAFSGTLRL